MADLTRVIEIQVDTEQGVKDIDKLNKSLETNEEQTKETKEETKKYNKQLEDTSKVTSGFVGQIDRMTGGMLTAARNFLTAAKSVKTFGLALKATGLGLVVAAIGAITAAFSRFEGPLRQITELLGGLDGVLGVVLDRFGFLGLALTDLLKGDLAGALENWKATWEGIGDAMSEAYDLGVLLARQIRENSVNESARNAVIAKNNREIEREILITRELTRSYQERSAALERAFQLQQENLDLTRKNAEEALQIAKNEFELSPAGPTGRKSAEAAIALNNAIEQYNVRILAIEKQRRELQNRRNEQLAKEVSDQQKITAEKEKQRKLEEATEESQGDVLDIFEQSLDRQSEFTKMLEERNKELDKQRDEAFDAQQEQSKQSIEDQNELNDALQITTASAEGLLDVFQGKVKGKDVFKAVLRTIGSILNVIAPGAGAITGVVSGLFADGGILKGPSHKDGGIWVNAEGGEGIINKRSMSIPWIRQLASDLNQIGGGVKFEDGGIVPTLTAQEAQLQSINQSLQEQRPVLILPDLTTEATKVKTIEDRATL